MPRLLKCDSITAASCTASSTSSSERDWCQSHSSILPRSPIQRWRRRNPANRRPTLADVTRSDILRRISGYTRLGVRRGCVTALLTSSATPAAVDHRRHMRLFPIVLYEQRVCVCSAPMIRMTGSRRFRAGSLLLLGTPIGASRGGTARYARSSSSASLRRVRRRWLAGHSPSAHDADRFDELRRLPREGRESE